MTETIRILVADDHPVVRDGLVAILSTQPDFEVVGEANNGRETVELAPLLQPDVIVLDPCCGAYAMPAPGVRACADG
jgi:DNA-binding NarL/FixJ family response regulator